MALLARGRKCSRKFGVRLGVLWPGTAADAGLVVANDAEEQLFVPDDAADSDRTGKMNGSVTGQNHKQLLFERISPRVRPVERCLAFERCARAFSTALCLSLTIRFLVSVSRVSFRALASAFTVLACCMATSAASFSS